MRSRTLTAGRTLVLAAGVLCSWTTAQSSPLLQLQGQPYFGGSMTLHLTGTAGQPALLVLGLAPLDQPVQTSKGAWYVGSLLNLVALGTMPAGGRIDLSFSMPPVMPAVAGVVIALQGYVPSQLTNPATLPLDLPYLLPADAEVLSSPNPQLKGEFGKYTSAGDLNGDGNVDIVIAAHKEDHLGVDMSGRVYVHWGPDFSAMTTLSPPSPVVAGFYGIGSAVADLDGQAPDDLIVAETTGDPAPAGNAAKLYIFAGGAPFATSPVRTVLSPGTGSEYSAYGAFPCVADFDGDGANDIAIGFPKADVGGLVDAGRIDVFLGPDFAVRVPVFSPEPVQGAGFGVRVATADVNGDRIADLVESSPGTPMPPWTLVGSAHLFVGPNFAHALTIPCPQPLGNLTRFGDMLEVADLSGDGVADLAIADSKNRVFVFRSPDYVEYVIVPKPPAAQQNPFGETAYGSELAAADINGDGRSDLLVSDHFEGEEGCALSSAGRVYGVLSPYLATFHRISDVQPQCGDSFGISVVPLQLDQDGRIELMIGANFADDGGLQSSGHITLLDGDIAGP